MAVESRVTQEEIKKEPEKPIDREKVWASGRCGAEAGRRACGRARPAVGWAGRQSGAAEADSPLLSSQTCPLLLRVFTTNNGRHHRMDEFSRGNVPSSELQIYTW